MNKIKVRKLRNVEKSVCCQEQKFAYNIAFRCHISFGDNYKKQMDNVTEAEKNKAIFEMRDFYLNTDEVKRGLEKLKLNKDAVFNVEIGEHYEKVSEFSHWLKIYDDEEKVIEFKADKITVYRAAMMGCIIHLINK